MAEQQQTLSLQQAIDLAVQHHTAGRLPQAETIYQQILQSNPNQPVALHLLGVVAHQVGKNDVAVDLITRAIAIDPDLAEAHSNLGNTLRELGRLDEAVASYRKALDLKPDYADAHNNLGNVFYDRGKLEHAATSYQKALSLKPDYAEAHYNLGNALQDLGKPDEAIASYHKALAIKPDYAEAHSNLGNALRDLGKLREAVTSYHKALRLKPENALAHDNLGNVLRDLGKPEEAVASYHKALDLKPDYAEAHNNLGAALADLGRLEDAIASYRKALDLRPDYAMAHSNLGLILEQLGRPIEAIVSHRRAISLNPQDQRFAANFAMSLEDVSFTSVDDNLYQDLLHLLEQPSVLPSHITPSVIGALRHHPDFSPIVEAISSNQQFAYSNIAEQLSGIPLFLRLLELTPIFDVEVERMLTALRSAMLRKTTERRTDDKGMPFSTALALHCFTNEYVFAETEEEKEAVEHLQEKIATLVEKDRPVPPSFVIALGAYRPLFQFSWAEKLNQREWENNITGVIKQQISEPLEERSLRDRIPSITSIQNTISQSVREQYEENPYPRWIKTSLTYKSRSLGAVLTGSPLFFDLGDYTSPESPDILMAGCGTGQHPVCIASRFSNARLLAVDLSLNSLAYAKRKTRELGFSNIEYVQGDILELGKIERQFDFIACVGVLHHLGDPLAGWQILVNLLRPGGLMNIGLYSEIGRQDIIVGRSLIAEKGYSTSPEDIRRCRQDIMAMAEDGNTETATICSRHDFFNMSNCRDLLFHVQEYRFTLPEIEGALKSLNLKFLGFEMNDQRPLRMFRESYPDSHDATSLSLWHKFELKNPDKLSGYPFWCQKL